MGECYLLFLQKLKNTVPPERIKKPDHFSKKLLEDKWVFSYWACFELGHHAQ